jgi:Rod binding domain-containing protein
MDSIQLPIGIDSARLRASDITRLRAGAATSAKDAPGTADTAQTAKKLESVFATLLVKEMRRSLSDGFFGDGAAGDIYSGWLDDHVGDALADTDALHMREMIERSVLQKPAVTT